MTKTTKLWISPALELRYAINGWPEVPPVKASIYADTFAMQQYEKKLAKAKVESILVEQSDNTPTMFKGVLEPDEFIEFEGSVEVVEQVNCNGHWHDISRVTMPHEMYPTRQVARLKSVDKSQLDSAGDKIPDGHNQCPICYGSGEKVPDVTCKKCEGSGYVPDSGAMSYTEGMTDAEMKEALEALKDQCPAGTKYRILEAFKYKCSGLGPKMQHDLLAQVLDDLKIN